MDDYISREAALNFEMEIEADPDEIQAITKGMALYSEHIKSIPFADVAEIVRCKNCKFWFKTSSDEFASCEKDALIRHKDHFCALGEMVTDDV